MSPMGIKIKFDELEYAGKWHLEEKTKTFSGLPLEDPKLLHRVYVYRIS
jgi:hypothetical protein